MAKKPILVTLLPSTDVDLGRWIMQHWGRDYVEHPHAPIAHVLALKWYGMGKDDYPLYVEGDRKIPTIGKIVKAFDHLANVDRRLVPDEVEEKALHDEVMELQHAFRFDMGGGTVHWAYYHFLKHRNLCWSSFTTGVPWYEKLFVALGFPLIRWGMTKGLNLSEATAEKGLADVLAGFDEVDAMLADGRRYLLGDRLTLADLAFAANGGPMVLAKGYGGHLPTIDEVPAHMRTVMEGLRARPAGAFVQRMYDEHRRAA